MYICKFLNREFCIHDNAFAALRSFCWEEKLKKKIEQSLKSRMPSLLNCEFSLHVFCLILLQ